MNEDTSTHPICSPWLLMFYGILLVKDALIVSQKNTLSLYWSNWNRLGGLCYFAIHVDPAHLSRCSSMNYTRPAITRKYSRGFNLYTDDSSLELRFLTGSVPYYKKTDEPLVPKPVRCDPLSPRPDNVDRVYHYHTSLRRVPICVGVDLTSWLD